MQFGNTNMEIKKSSGLDLDAVAERLLISFSQQLEQYDKLLQITKKMTATISLKKGDLSAVMPFTEDKGNVLIEIEKIKEASLRDITIWKVKKSSATGEMAEDLDYILEQIEAKITKFLKAEMQLQRQIEFYQKS